MLRGLSFGKRAPESVIPLADIPTFKQFAAKEKEIADVAAKAQKKTKASYTPFVDKIRLFRGDITRLQVDAIVNAANTSLWAGGGVCGAIHHAAGTELERECTKIGHCATGQTVITKGYKLPAKHVLHAVGPTRTDDKALASCYATCLERCVENELRSVAFCCISTGIYGFPNDRACNVALTTVRNWLDHDKERAAKIDAIIFCTFLAEDYKLYISNIPLLFPLEPTTAAAASEEPESASAVSAVAAASEAPKSPVGETEATDMEEKKPFAVNSPSAPHSPSPPPPPPPPGESDSFAPAAVDESKSAEPGSTGLPLPSSSPASSSDFAPTQPGESEKDTSAPMQTEPEGESVPPAP